MATILTVGPGKTYDSAAGITNALAAVPTDFSGESDHWIIRITKGYNYTCPVGGHLKTILNTTINKHLIIEAESGSEHKGTFNNGVVCLINSTSESGNVARFFDFTEASYTEMHNLQIRIDSTSSERSQCIRFSATTSNTLCQNIIGSFESVNSPDADIHYLMLYMGATSGHVNNNSVVWSALALNRRGISCDTGSSGKINNAIVYNVPISVEGPSGAVWEMNNSGGIGPTDGSGTGRFDCPSFTGASNYTNTTSGSTPGTGFITGTLAQFAFINIASKNFKLKITSTLIGVGADVTADNPNSIDLQPWNGNHRSPFNNIKLVNTFQSAPEIETVYGNYENELILADPLMRGNPLVGGKISIDLLTYPTNYEHNQFGPILRSTNANAKRYYNLGSINGTKKMTFGVLTKTPTGIGSDQTYLANNNYSLITNNTTKTLKLTLSVTYIATGDFTGLINANDWYSFIVVIDLSQSTDANRVKMYVFQKGQYFKLTVGFSGTAPSTFNVTNPQFSYLGESYIGNLCAWNRTLSFEELYNFLLDPYGMYRDDEDIDTFLSSELILSSNGMARLSTIAMFDVRVSNQAISTSGGEATDPTDLGTITYTYNDMKLNEGKVTLPYG